MGTAICSILHCLLNTFLGSFLWWAVTGELVSLLKGCVINPAQCSFYSTSLQTMARLSWNALSRWFGIEHMQIIKRCLDDRIVQHTRLWDIHSIIFHHCLLQGYNSYKYSIIVHTKELANRLKNNQASNNPNFNAWYQSQRSPSSAGSLYCHFGLLTRTDFSGQMILHPLLAE